MTNRAGSSSGENRNVLTTGRPPERNWNETRNMMDSGIEFTDNQCGPTPPQPGGRKRHADEDTLQIPYADVPDGMRTMPWDGPHKRILFESEDPDSTVSGSETQEARLGWPPDDMWLC